MIQLSRLLYLVTAAIAEGALTAEAARDASRVAARVAAGFGRGGHRR